MFKDKTGEPRSDEEIKEAIKATKKEFIMGPISILKVYMPTIFESLEELLLLRKVLK